MQIIFTTFNARYSHTALALRCLRANLGALRDQSEIVEFDNCLSPQTAAEKLLERNPDILLFSIYIWNLTVISETVTILRTLRPELKIIIGGPEVSYEHDDLSLFKNADHLICGEGEEIIEAVCTDLLAGKTLPKVIAGPVANLKNIIPPYEEYTDEDIAHRRIYVETSRGCPSKCQYCLSALENGVRFFPLETLFPMFGKLIERGARIFKFIDRSFNANTAHAAAILRFFLENRCDGMMLHLEWEPHRLPKELKQLLAEAPDGFIQLEVG
ncbi:MAG: cobalamin-dependent protein, partial [Kiritimatiellales bacterium]|nr:cobalamin-dependent protein [Kiritimatiellales bacterium]